jgi:hypothetical protein
VTVLLRGIRHRAGRSAVVALLAATAVAAAVLAPGFSRAAQQSVLTDGLGSAPAAATGVTITATGTAAAVPAAHAGAERARRDVDEALARHRVLAEVLDPPVAGLDTDTVVAGGTEVVAARLAYRERVCQAMAVAGECPSGAGEVLVSARTAEQYRIAPGDTLAVGFATGPREVVVTGTYAPVDPASPYWGRTVYFAHGGFDATSGAPRVDAVFTGGEADVLADPSAVVDAGLTYPLAAGAVQLDRVGPLRADLRAFTGAVRAGGRELGTELPAILDDVAADRSAIGRTAPVVAVPLLLLVWFVLFLLVAALTEERGPEIALARLRGFPGPRAVRFGLGEVLVLIVLAAPVGVGLGLLLVEASARLALAEGAHVELRWPVLLAAVAALAAAAAAAAAAGRSTLRRGALNLLRRVPERTGWRAGVVEGAVVALAAASLMVAVGDPTAPLALLAPATVAVLAGVAAARLARLWAGVRLRRSERRGRIAGLLSAAQLSRRPAGARVIVVVTVAVGLLTFGATAWDVAAQARHDHATDAVGADRVLTVHADHPGALVQAVRAADPAGTTMAVVRAGEQYAGEQVEVLAVDSPRLAGTATWRGRDRDALAGLAAAVRPSDPAPLWLTGQVEVSAVASDLGEDPVRLAALVSAPGAAPRAVPLGTLGEGERGYAAQLRDCAPEAGCRLLGLQLGRTGVSGPFQATVEVRAIRSGDGELPARLDDPGAWPPVESAELSVTHAEGLTVTVARRGGGDLVVSYQDTPAAVPAVLAGAAPADQPDAAEFEFLGLGERPEPFAVVERSGRLPRAGGRGLLVDLEYAVYSAERSVALSDGAGLRYEVWAGAGAPADLAQRLAGAGVPVLRIESISGTLDQLGRRAPALGLWLYLLAAVAATGLALGVVALSTRVGASDRRHELAALRVCGVRGSVLRRALLREHAALLGTPLLVGVVVGVVAAALMLPGIPLVETGAPGGAPAYRLELGALPVAVAATTAGLLLAARRAVRLPLRATPDRLRRW